LSEHYAGGESLAGATVKLTDNVVPILFASWGIFDVALRINQHNERMCRARYGAVSIVRLLITASSKIRQEKVCASPFLSPNLK
jgi:hypothetical protein